MYIEVMCTYTSEKQSSYSHYMPSDSLAKAMINVEFNVLTKTNMNSLAINEFSYEDRVQWFSDMLHLMAIC